MDIFTPRTTKTLNVTSISSNTSLTSSDTTLRIYNAGPNTAFIKIGDNSAAVTDLPIPADVIEVFDKGSVSVISAICSTNQTALLYITSGAGA